MTGDVHYQHDSTSLVWSSYSENPWQCYDKALLTLDVSVCQIVRPLPSPISLPTNSTCCNSPWRLQLSLHLVDMTLSRGKPQQLNKMTLWGLPMDPKSKWFARYQWAVWTTVSHDFRDLEESYQSMAQTAKSESKLLLLQVPILLYTSPLPSLDT